MTFDTVSSRSERVKKINPLDVQGIWYSGGAVGGTRKIFHEYPITTPV